MSIAIGIMGMDYETFMELTPAEFRKIHKAHTEHQTDMLDTQHKLIFNAIVQTKSKKRFKSVFEHKKNKAKSEIVPADRKQDEVAEILKQLRGE